MLLCEGSVSGAKPPEVEISCCWLIEVAVPNPARAQFISGERLLGPGPDAEDVVQDVLLSVLQHDKFDPSPGPLRTYLFGAVRNRALKRQRVVAEVLELELAAVKSRLHRAREA
jgi:hypothetical protein